MNDALASTFTATDLMARDFAPIEYAVPGLVPQGLSLLVAAPKIGKSWLVLGLGVAVAGGTRALGALAVQQRPVLYLALEDGAQRLQARLRSLGVTKAPAGLHFAVSLTSDVLTTVEAFLAEHAKAKPLVILDTLGKVMPPARPQEAQYERDYRVGSRLKACVDAVPGSALIVVHHTRKAAAEDFVESASGTHGLTGAADTIMVLRRNRHEDTATLAVTSRDAAEGEYALTIDALGQWTLNGTTLAEASRAATAHRTSAGLGDLSTDIVQALVDHPRGIRAQDLATELGSDDHTVRTYLQRLHSAGRVQRISRGLYAPLPIPPVASVASEGNPGQNATTQRNTQASSQEAPKE